MCHNSSTCTVRMWAEFGHSHFNLGKLIVNQVRSAISKLCSLRNGHKKYFQVKILFGNQLRNGTKIKPILYLNATHYTFLLCVGVEANLHSCKQT